MTIRKLFGNKYLSLYLFTAFIVSLLPSYVGLSSYLFVVLILLQHVFFAPVVKGFKSDAIVFILLALFVYFLLQVSFIGSGITDLFQVILFFFVYIISYNTMRQVTISNQDTKNLSLVCFIILTLLFISKYRISETGFGGIYINPNTTALYGLFYYTFFLLNKRISILKRVVFLTVLFFLIVITGSRNALLALTIGESIRLISLKLKISFIGYVLVLVLVLFLVLNIVEFVNYIYTEYSILDGSSRIAGGYSGRDLLYEMSFKEFCKKPLFGWGFSKQLYFETEDGSFLNSHNSYIDMLVRFGVVGVLFYMTFILILLRKVSRVYDVHFRSLGMMVIYVWSIIIANETFAFKFKYHAFLFIIIVALCLNLGNKKQCK